MAYTERKDAPFRKRGGFHRKKKVCVFCGKDNAMSAYFAARTMRSIIRTLQSFASMCLRAARSFLDGSPVPAQLIRER